MNSYITQGTTITVQTSVLKETINNDKNALNNKKELIFKYVDSILQNIQK